MIGEQDGTVEADLDSLNGCHWYYRHLCLYQLQPSEVQYEATFPFMNVPPLTEPAAFCIGGDDNSTADAFTSEQPGARDAEMVNAGMERRGRLWHSGGGSDRGALDRVGICLNPRSGDQVATAAGLYRELTRRLAGPTRPRRLSTRSVVSQPRDDHKPGTQGQGLASKAVAERDQGRGKEAVMMRNRTGPEGSRYARTAATSSELPTRAPGKRATCDYARTPRHAVNRFVP